MMVKKECVRLWGLIRWSLIGNRYYLPVFVSLQTLFSLAMVVGLSLFLPTENQELRIYLASGSVVMGLIAMTCVLAPQMVSEKKNSGVLAYQQTLPVSRLSILLADLFVWGGAIVPGLVLSILAGAVFYKLDLTLSFISIGLLLLVSLGWLLFGFALAYLLAAKWLSLFSQLILMAALLFSPILYPADRLPAALLLFYDFLPFLPGARLLRASLYGLGQVSALDGLILLFWLLISGVGAMQILTRRK